MSNLNLIFDYNIVDLNDNLNNKNYCTDHKLTKIQKY